MLAYFIIFYQSWISNQIPEISEDHTCRGGIGHTENIWNHELISLFIFWYFSSHSINGMPNVMRLSLTIDHNRQSYAHVVMIHWGDTNCPDKIPYKCWRKHFSVNTAHDNCSNLLGHLQAQLMFLVSIALIWRSRTSGLQAQSHNISPTTVSVQYLVLNDSRRIRCTQLRGPVYWHGLT